MAVRRCLLQGLLKQAYHSIGVESPLYEMSVIRGQHETAFRNLSCDIDRLRRGARDARWPLWAEHRDTDSDSSQSVLSYDHGHSRQMRRGRALMGQALVPRKWWYAISGYLGCRKSFNARRALLSGTQVSPD